jgi:SDR family mycofactocin-dependent oxidoreductase
MGRLDDKVAFVTGGARGQGRSHAIRLAQEGAHVIIVDSVGGGDAYPWNTAYAMATKPDLVETSRLVEATGRGVVARVGDVRDVDSLRDAVAEGVAKFGRIDIVSANAGISPYTGEPETWNVTDERWNDVVDVNLGGVRNTIRAAVPAMIEAGNGGAIVITSSGAGLKGVYGLSDYCSTKFGVIGLARSLANEVAPHNIRVNVIAPGTVRTDMVLNDGLFRMFRPDLEAPTEADVAAIFTQMSMLPIPWVDPVDISNALVFLASDEARYITGVTLPVDAGMSAR